MTEAELGFLDAMGRHFEAEGVPRIGGRMFAFLLLREEPCSLDDIVEQLGVSKASVSTNARLLEAWALIQRVGRPGDRRDFYQVSPDPARTLELQLARIRAYGTLLRQGVSAASKPEIAARLEAMAEFNEQSIAALEPLVSRWKQGRPDGSS